MIIVLLATAGCSVHSRYKIAHDLYMHSNYPTAIEHYDNFLALYPHGALATKAELERSDCYYQLGYKAYERENWILASRLFYLANSAIADSKLDDCYKALALEAISLQDTAKAMYYYDYIITYLTNSELVPEMFYNKIHVHLARNEYFIAFNLYHQLWTDYPDSDFRKNIQPEIDVLIPDFLQEALDLKDNGDYDAALDICFRLSQYPSKQQADIIDEISNLYWLMAESQLSQDNLRQARIYFHKVYEYSPERKSQVLQRIEDVCQGFLDAGGNMEAELKFDSAISIYQQCFKIVEDHPLASRAISEALETKRRYYKALDTFSKAEEEERLKEYKKALDLYQQANNLFETDEAQYKIFIMQNILEAEKDPKAFAQHIADNYKNGILYKNIAIVEEYLKARYGEAVKTTGWKVTYAIGLYKYEVRYDLLSAYANFYFAWRVDLKTRQLTPSNKISELLITDLDEVILQID